MTRDEAELFQAAKSQLADEKQAHAVTAGALLATQEELRTSQHWQATAYSGRSILLSLLSRIFPAWIQMHVHDEGDAAWDPGWRHVLFLTLDTGQVSFHISDEDVAQYFEHVERRPGNDWDRSTVDEKWERVLAARPVFAQAARATPDAEPAKQDVKPGKGKKGGHAFDTSED